MGITNIDVARFVALAGDDFAWAGVRGCARPPATVRRALRGDLLDRQGGICPVCGETGEARGAWEFNHVVARGNGVRGWVRGNIFAGHSSCNALTKPLHDANGAVVSGIAVLWVEHFARPDVIPTDWTPFPILKTRPRD